MAFPYKKQATELLQSLLMLMPNSYQKTIGFPTYDIMNAISMKLAELSEKVQLLIYKLDYNNLYDEELERYVWQHKGLKRRAATFATAKLQIDGHGLLQKGTFFATSTGILFEVVQDVTLEGVTVVPVKAVVAGSSGNVPASSITEMPVTVQGVNSVTNPEAASGGYEAESDAELKARFEHALKKPATSGNVFHYEVWANEVQGVGACKVESCPTGPNTVGIIIIGNDGQPASAELVAAVQTYIDPNGEGLGKGAAPLGAHCTVRSAKALTLDLQLQLLGRYEESAKQALEKSVRDYLKSVAFKQNYISYAMIANAIMDAKGVIDYQNLTINGSTSNISVADDMVAVLGVVTYV